MDGNKPNPAYFRTTITVEVLSEGRIATELPVDKLLSYLEYQGTFGHNSNKITVTAEEKLSERELVKACIDHGTDPNFFLALAAETGEHEEDEHGASLGI